MENNILCVFDDKTGSFIPVQQDLTLKITKEKGLYGYQIPGHNINYLGFKEADQAIKAGARTLLKIMGKEKHGDEIYNRAGGSERGE